VGADYGYKAEAEVNTTSAVQNGYSNGNSNNHSGNGSSSNSKSNNNSNNSGRVNEIQNDEKEGLYS
jgi:hypothetical protein